MSKRARAAAIKREGARLFAGVGDLKGASNAPKLPESEHLRKHAAMLLDLADRGMSATRYRRLAAAMLLRADRLG